MPPTAPLSDVRNLEVLYRDVSLARRGISLRVDAGTVVALPGANRAGTTSILNCLCGVSRPQSGTIRFEKRR